MLSANVHLIFSHIPIIGTPILLFLFGYSIIYKKSTLHQYVLWLYIIIFTFGIILIITGDPSAELIENYPGINKDLIEEHENFAYLSFWLMFAVVLLSAYSIFLIRRRNNILNWINYAIIVLSFVSVLTLLWTGRLGGSIRHPEVFKSLSSITIEITVQDKI